MERSQKFGSQLTPKVNAIQEGDKQMKKNTEVEQALMKELRELKARPPQAQNLPTQQPMRQTPQCRTCQQSGNRWLCNHCFSCGASSHYARECTTKFSRRSPAEFQGNGQRSRPWDRVWSGMKISPVVFSVENKEQNMYRLAAAELVKSVGIVQRDVK